MRTPGPRTRIALHEVAAVVVLLAGTVAACWPWIVPGRGVFGQRDSAFTILASRHLLRAALGEHSWTQGPLGWPTPWSVTQADFTAGQGLLLWPFEALGLEPFSAMNFVGFLGIFLTAWAAHHLARALLGSGPHTWVAGIAAACHPLHLAHAQHVNLIHHEWMVLGALLLGWGLVKRRPGVALGGSLALAASPWFGLYMGMHAAMAGGIVLVGAAIARQGDRRSWLAAVAGLLLGAAAFVPVLVTYARAGFLFEVFADPTTLAKFSWDPSTTLAPIQRSPLHQWIFGLDGMAGSSANNPANPGYLAALLALLGLVAWRARPGHRWAWWVVGAVAAVAGLLALGPAIVWDGQATAIPGPYRLLDWIPGFYGLRDPVRWLGVCFVALGLIAGLGAWWAARWLQRWGPVPGALLGLLLVVGLVAERATARTARLQGLQLHPVYRELDAIEGEGPLWDNALSAPSKDRSCSCNAARAYRAALYHGRPLVGGTAARGTDASRAMLRVLMTWPSGASRQLLRAAGARAVLDHSGARIGPIEGLDCTVVQEHVLCEVESRPPLPAPEAVRPQGDGEVVGLRWPSTEVGTLEIRCGERVIRADREAWWVVTAMRHGGDTEAVEVFLEEPCDGIPEATPGGWEPLYADADAPPWPPPWRSSGPGMAQAFEDVKPAAPPQRERQRGLPPAPAGTKPDKSRKGPPGKPMRRGGPGPR